MDTVRDWGMDRYRRFSRRRADAEAFFARSHEEVMRDLVIGWVPAFKGRIMTAEERREKARLRSERWRRAHGIMPRRPAQRPWLAEGISRSTWYRRRKQTRERQALTLVATAQEAVFDRLDWQLAQLRRELETAARFADKGTAILAELAAMGNGAL